MERKKEAEKRQVAENERQSETQTRAEKEKKRENETTTNKKTQSQPVYRSVYEHTTNTHNYNIRSFLLLLLL